MLQISNRYNSNKFYNNFKSHSGFTDVKDSSCSMTVNNYTTFFRNYPTMVFLKKYLQKEFPEGAKIAEFGCSQGQKPLSLMVVLDDINKDKRYKITGYDFPEVIEKIKLPLYGLSFYTEEEQPMFEEYNKSELFGNKKYIPPLEAERLRKCFFSYFNVYKPRDVITCERYRQFQAIADNPKCLPSKKKRAEYGLAYSSLIRNNSIVVEATKKTKDVVDFKAGDINKINRILSPKGTQVVIFQNALYHILQGGIKHVDDEKLLNIKKVTLLFDKINKVLPKNGLFVLGSWGTDNLYDYEKESQTRLIYQDNKRIRVYDTSLVHNALRQKGFEPVFYEKIPYGTAFVAYRDVHLPAVWKKVRNV